MSAGPRLQCASVMQTTMALLGNNFPCPWDDLLWWSGSFSSQPKLYFHEAAAWFLLTFFPLKKSHQIWISFLSENMGFVHMTLSPCRGTRELYELLKQINRNESVGEKHLVLRPYIPTLQNLGEGGRKGGRERSCVMTVPRSSSAQGGLLEHVYPFTDSQHLQLCSPSLLLLRKEIAPPQLARSCRVSLKSTVSTWSWISQILFNKRKKLKIS